MWGRIDGVCEHRVRMSCVRGWCVWKGDSVCEHRVRVVCVIVGMVCEHRVRMLCVRGWCVWKGGWCV